MSLIPLMIGGKDSTYEQVGIYVDGVLIDSLSGSFITSSLKTSGESVNKDLSEQVLTGTILNRTDSANISNSNSISTTINNQVT